MDLSRQNCVNVDKYQIRFFFFQCYCFSFPINTKPHLSSFLHLIFHSSPTPFIPTLLPTPSFHPQSPSHTFLSFPLSFPHLTSSSLSFPHLPFIRTLLLTPSFHPHSPSLTFPSSPLSFPHLPVIPTLLPTPYFHPHSPFHTFLSSALSF